MGRGRKWLDMARAAVWRRIRRVLTQVRGSVHHAFKACQPFWPILAIGALIAQSVLGRIDGALRARHVEGAVSGGVGDVAAPTTALKPEVAGGIVSGWRSADALLSTYLGVDLALMVLLSLLLLLVRARLLGWLAQGERQRPPPEVERPADEQQLTTAAASALRWSVLAVLGYLVADLVETATAVGVGLAGHLPVWAAMVIGVSSLAKWACLVLTVLPMALVGLAVPALRQSVFAWVKALRGLIVVAVALIVIFLLLRGDIGRQIDDVVSHAAESFWRSGAATVLALITASAMVVGGRRCLEAYRRPPTVCRVSLRFLVWTTVIAVLLVAVGMLVSIYGPARYGPVAVAVLAVPGVALVVWSLLTWPHGVRRLEIVHPVTGSKPGTGDVGDAVPWVWVLASVPPLLLALAVVRAATTAWAVQGSIPYPLLVWGAVLVVPPVAWLVWRAVRHDVRSAEQEDLARSTLTLHEVPRQEGAWWTLVALALGAGAAFVGHEEWMALGSVGVVFLFALIGVFLAVGLTLLGDALAPRGALALTGLRRLPVMTMLVLWGLIASILDTEGRYYDTRLVGAGTADSASAVEATDALTTWLGPSPTSGSARGEDRSLVFVTASGGGIRAAYWTQLVWECFFGTHCDQEEVRAPGRSDQVFLASGVSGGAVGLSLVRGGTAPPGERHDLLNRDFLAPALAAAISRDLPNSILRLPWAGHDRAAALADGIASVDAGLTERFQTLQGLPHLALSGTSIEDGCRLTLSTIQQATDGTRCGGVVSALPDNGPRAAPVRDGLAFLCDRDQRPADIAVVDAALLSARFPYVSPTASMHGCDEDETTYVLDGGMFDNSGGSSVSNVLAALGPALDQHNQRVPSSAQDERPSAADRQGLPRCVIPRLLVIENQFASNAQPLAAGRTMQSLGPGQAVLSFYGDRSDRELARAVEDVTRAAERAEGLCYPSGGGPSEQVKILGDGLASVVIVHPVLAGGVAAPLGWTLAESTRLTMAGQLQPDCDRVSVNGDVSGGGSTEVDQERVGPDDEGQAAHVRKICAAYATVDAWLGEAPR